jgi:hypothetical protein
MLTVLIVWRTFDMCKVFVKTKRCTVDGQIKLGQKLE